MADRSPLHCPYCGDLEWTVKKYGRETHKEACPYRLEAWSQSYPQRRVWTGAHLPQRRLNERMETKDG